MEYHKDFFNHESYVFLFQQKFSRVKGAPTLHKKEQTWTVVE